MKKLMLGVLFVAVLAILANDGGRVFVAHSELKADTTTLASWASNNASELPRDQAAAQLVEKATALGIRISQYGQNEDGIEIWTERDVTGLWVLGAYKASLAGVPLKQAMGRPIVITDHTVAEYR